MTLPVGSILRVVQDLVWDDGNHMQNVYNCVISGAGGPFDEADIADDMSDWMESIYTQLAPDMVNQLNFGQAKTYVYDAIDDDWDEIGAATPAVTPVGTGDALPYGVAVMLQADSTDPDVSARKFFGGFSEGVQTDGSWVGALSTLMIAVGLDWVTAFTGATSAADFTPGVWSPTNTVFKAFVGDFVVNVIANYQRRRRPGVGI